MPSFGPIVSNLTVNDIFSFSDEELVQYMKQNRRADGGFDLECEGWENLAKEQRDQLAQRLKAAALKANDEVHSRPVDLDAVAARLREISDNQEALPIATSRSPSYERPSTVICDKFEETKQDETRAYHELVKDGGRPVYPISRLEEVLNNPEGHREILLPWQPNPDLEIPHADVFMVQLATWKIFRYWQKKNRDIYNVEEEFAAYSKEEWRRETERIASLSRSRRKFLERDERKYLEKLRDKFLRMQEEKGVDDEDAGFSAFLEEEKRRNIEAGVEWPGMTEHEYRQSLRIYFNRAEYRHNLEYFYWLREDHGRGGFPEYVAEARRRLAKHGFTRDFQLDEDPTRQDKLTTWIEYLNYEYAWYDRYERSINHLRPEYEEAWKKLVDSGVLQPGETDKNLRTIESSARRQAEEDQAEEAVKSAERVARAALLETEKAKVGRSRLTTEERKRRLVVAHSRLVAAKEARKALKIRGDLITDFVRGAWDYTEEERNIYRQRVRLQWALEQLPLIEAELDESNGSRAGRGAKRSKPHQSDDGTDVGGPTERKEDEPSEPADDTGASARARTPPKRGGHDDTNHPRPLKRPRNDSNKPTSHATPGMSDISKNCLSRSTETSQSQATGERSVAEKRINADTRNIAGQTLSRPPGNGHGDTIKLRRSARIAARQGPSGTAVTHPHATDVACRRSRRKLSEERVPLSPSTRLRGRQPKSTATNVARKRGNKM
ncbi:uncharacterized protein P884DRAFT_206220 [Thermothelomyces heterothallicus CBS 202.75]|uniref:uncharacterized protein n=1 Tax=Thermothelomyces heterothallicus CBS 202.75 TaxID=1149848 RepID=UPI003743CF5A